MCFFSAHPSSPRRYIPRNTHFSKKQTALFAEEQRRRCLLSHRDSPDALRVLRHEIQRKHDVPTGSVPVFGGACSAELEARESGFEKHSKTQPDVIVSERDDPPLACLTGDLFDD